jgi:hypothetical protein
MFTIPDTVDHTGASVHVAASGCTSGTYGAVTSFIIGASNPSQDSLHVYVHPFSLS